MVSKPNSPPPPKFKPLNALELAELAKGWDHLEGQRLERLVIPKRDSGFIKGEFALRFENADLLVSLETQAPYVALFNQKSFKNNNEATLSVFLTQVRGLKNQRLRTLEVLPKERVVRLGFDGADLLLVLIPSRPDGLVCEPGGPPFVVAMDLRGKPPATPLTFSPPTDLDLPIRNDLGDWCSTIQNFRRNQAHHRRAQQLLNGIAQDLRKQERLLAKARTSFIRAEKEPDYALWGEVYKAHGLPPSPTTQTLLDYTTNKEVTLELAPKLSPKEQLERFFHLHKRKTLRLEEAKLKMEAATAQLEGLRLRRQEVLEGNLGEPVITKSKKKVQAPKWKGRRFVSSEGLTILVGTKESENSELTFRIARGNDLWFHVRGRPGAHVVVLLPKGGNASLETLLDAAHLALHYSGAQDWGLTEVDYTHRKWVKRIPGGRPAQVHYNENKTLRVSHDPSRIQALFGRG